MNLEKLCSFEMFVKLKTAHEMKEPWKCIITTGALWKRKLAATFIQLGHKVCNKRSLKL